VEVESSPQQEIGQDRTVDVSCPAGMVVSGGGERILTDDASLPKPQVLTSHPLGAFPANAWEAQAWSAVPGAQWRLYVFALCV
jgi:hypothetical protein